MVRITRKYTPGPKGNRKGEYVEKCEWCDERPARMIVEIKHTNGEKMSVCNWICGDLANGYVPDDGDMPWD